MLFKKSVYPRISLTARIHVMKTQELPLFSAPAIRSESTIKVYAKGDQPPSWWTPVYSGLLIDPGGKHRIRIGPAIWVYLYLITYAKRKTGVTHRNVTKISEETGMSPRSIHRHLNRLEANGYIRFVERRPVLKILITKWKNFGKRKVSPRKGSESHRINSPGISSSRRTLQQFSH